MKMVKAMMALALVFALVVPAVMADDVCVPCVKCPPLDLGCPSGDQWGGVSCVVGDDYHMTWTDPTMMPTILTRPVLDANMDSNADGKGGVMGYAYPAGSGYYPDCPIIFNICACDDTSQFRPGVTVAARMKILVNGMEGNNGVYFNEYYTGNAMIARYQDFLCDPNCGTNIRVQLSTDLSSQAWYCDVNGGGTYSSGEDAWRPASATGISYYTWSGTTYQFATPTFPNTCIPADAEKIVAVACDNLVTLQQIDEELTLCRWSLDVPSVIVSPTITECSTISVRVDLIIDIAGDICSESIAECSCIYDMYTVCCESEAHSLIFPYFTSVGGDDGYWNGIAITNLSSSAGTATMTVYEQDGSVGTFTTPMIGGAGSANCMYVNLLEAISWSGTGLGNSRCWIQVSTDFNADGFAMMADRSNHDSMGYLPRQPGN